LTAIETALQTFALFKRAIKEGNTMQSASRPTEVTATLKFSVVTPDQPVRYKGKIPAGEPERSGSYESRSVSIRNGRTAGISFVIDQHGFALKRHTAPTINFYDPEAVKSSYYPEVAAFVEREVGASKVVVFDHTARSNVEGAKDMAGIRGPATRVHNDYTVTSAPKRVRDLFPQPEADALLQKRFAIINLWRPIRGPLEDAPLALCDASSASEQDFIVSALVYPDRVGETYGVAYSDRQQWFYFPDMEPDEAILLKCFDSDEERARFTPHGAFQDPIIAKPRPRESIELRTLAFFD
jgi:hypothetical protein